MNKFFILKSMSRLYLVSTATQDDVQPCHKALLLGVSLRRAMFSTEKI